MKKDLSITKITMVLLLAVVTLAPGCKKETQTGTSLQEATRVNKAGRTPWPMLNLPYSADFNAECRNYLAIKDGRGC